jgi:two-component system, NtrC family, sensor kinase
MHVQRRRALPDKNREVEQLTEEVALLRNALKREKAAKITLQNKLEERVEVNYKDNQSFLLAYEQANSRQIQLQFLASLTNNMLAVRSIDEMITEFIGKISMMLDGCEAYCVSTEKTNDYTLSLLEPSTRAFSSIECPQGLEDCVEQLHSLTEQADVWKRLELDSQLRMPALKQLFNNKTVIYSQIKLSDTKYKIFILGIEHYCYSDEFKQTLNTASQQFSLMVKRRLTEIELSYNYQKLKNILAELRSTQKQLAHSDKMASLGQLSAGMAHEINNPLSYISSNLDILKDYCLVFEQAMSESTKPLSNEEAKALDYARNDVQDLISSCIKGAQRIAEIVSSLKTFSRKNYGEFQSTDMNDVIESALKIVWNKLKYNIHVSKNLTTPLPPISANCGQLQQVLINLLDNAAHAMQNKGTLTICTRTTNGYVDIEISDTGCGMSNESIKRLFEPFYTTKAENEGTGLGLSVSYAIIEKHDGLISVNSQPNRGSTFTLRFPIISSS